MDHQGAFAADESIDTVHRTEAGRSRVGEDAMLAGEGGIEASPKTTSNISQTERTPLLDGTAIDSEDEREPPRQPWANGIEWEHLPWHKRPSVRQTHICMAWVSY